MAESEIPAAAPPEEAQADVATPQPEMPAPAAPAPAPPEPAAPKPKPAASKPRPATPAPATPQAAAPKPEASKPGPKTSPLDALRALAAAHGAELVLPAAEELASGELYRAQAHHPHSVERFVAAARACPFVRAVQVLPSGIDLWIEASPT